MKKSSVSKRNASASSSDLCWQLLGIPEAKRHKGSSMNSGVLQPTDFEVRIVFADAGCIPSRLRKHLIKDERLHLKPLNLLDTATLYDAT